MERERDSSGLRWIFTGAVVLLIGAFLGLALSYLRSSPPAPEPEQVTREMPSRPPQPTDQQREIERPLQAERSRETGRQVVSSSAPPQIMESQPLSGGPETPKADRPDSSLSLRESAGEVMSEPPSEQKTKAAAVPPVRDEPAGPSTEEGPESEAEKAPQPAAETGKQPEDRPTDDRTVSIVASPQTAPATEEAGKEAVVDRREPSASQEPAAEEAAQEEAPTEFAFTIHIGSYKDPDNAQKQLAQLQSLGVEAFSRRVDLPKKGVFHRVFVGRCADRSEAETLQGRLRKEPNLPKGRIVTARFTRGG